MTSTDVSAPHRRFDRYTRWSLYAVLPLPPLVAAGFLSDASAWTWATLPHLIALTTAVVLCLPVLRAALARAHRGTPWSVPVLVAFVVVALAAAALGALAAPPGPDPTVDAPSMLVLISLVVIGLGVGPALTWRQSGWLGLAMGVVTTLVWIAQRGGFGSEEFSAGRWFPVLFVSTVAAVGLCWSVTLTVWMQRQMEEQAELTVVRSELAVAEERLRFSRDLHDIFGRTLTAVTVKSDLAAELAELGRSDHAATQMREVHQLAEDALREVRDVVGGYRTVDLAAELRGARALLGAAGIRTRVIGDGATLPTAVAEALAWVVREGATNVVHHSRAGMCTISVEPDARDVALTITNDGLLPREAAPDVPGGRVGSGLTGLRDRLAPLGGTLETGTDRGRFTLTARIPRETP